MRQNIRIISHNDLDGFGAVVVAKCVYGKFFTEVKVNDRQIEYLDYSIIPNLTESEYISKIKEEMSEWNKYSLIFVTDLSLPATVLTLFEEYNKHNKDSKVYYFDHHKSTIINCKDIIERNTDWCIVKAEDRFEVECPQCGTSLLFNWLCEKYNLYNDSDIVKDGLIYDKLCDFVEYVRLWDTFNHINTTNYEGSRQAIILQQIHKDMHSIEYLLRLIIDTSSKFLIPSELAIYITNVMDSKKKAMKKQIQDYGHIKYLNPQNMRFRNTYDFVISDGNYEDVGYRTLVMFGNVDISVARDVATEFLNIEIIIVWNPQAGKIEFRVSDDCDFDAGKFATELGGGGHAKAAGVTYKTPTYVPINIGDLYTLDKEVIYDFNDSINRPLGKILSELNLIFKSVI